MGYSFTPYHENVSDDELISDLIRVARDLNSNTLTQQQYREFGKYGSDKIVYRFHSWNNALTKAKLHTSANSQYSLDDLYENIERVWIAKGKQPVRADMNNKAISSISSGAYLRRFGTWTNALQSFVAFMNTDDDETSELASEQAQSRNYQRSEVRSVNLRLRWKVIMRDNCKCCCCGASPAVDPTVSLQVDHVLPYSRGGRTTLDNLQTLCSKCNLGKGNLLE